MSGEGGGGGDVRLVGRNREAAAHVVGRGGAAAIDQQIAAADGVEAELADTGRCLHVFADEGFGVAAAYDGEEQQGVRFGGELTGRTGKQDDRLVRSLADERGCQVHGALGDEAASKQYRVDSLEGHIIHPDKVLGGAGVVGVDEDGQSLSAGGAVGLQRGDPPR